MLSRHKTAAAVMIAGGLLLCLTGCAARVGVGYRAYDPYYRDYHVWVDPEPTYYHEWIGETHRQDREFRRLKRADQREYWTWRHSRHPDKH